MSVLEKLINNVPSGNRAITIPETGLDLEYGQLRSVVNEFKADLAKLGNGRLLKPQDPVSIAIPNGFEYVVSFLGVTGAALIAAPLNSQYKQSEFEFYLDDMKSRLLLVPQGGIQPAIAAAKKFGVAVASVGWDGKKVTVNLVEPGSKPLHSQPSSLRSSTPNDIAFVLHTSGTTGRPKAVPLIHRNMLASVRNIVGTYKLTEADVSYLVMPLFHVHGLLAGLLSPLGSGGAVIIPPKFTAHKFWDQYVKHGGTWYTAVPTIHQIVLKQNLPSPKPRIRFIRSCSSSLAPSVFKELESKLGAPVLEAYAMTEACHQMTSNCLSPDVRKPGTVGVGHGVEVVILDPSDTILPPNTEGEISIRGPNVTPGYLNNAKANAESFTKGTHFFRTGDQGKIDDDGMLVITGRIKELINRGGEKISPIELDSVLLSHSDVSEAVSFGAPDKMYGQVVNAAVVLSPGAHVTEKQLMEYVASKVSKFKVPTKIFFTDVMPKTATGKIQRRLIAQKFITPQHKL